MLWRTVAAVSALGICICLSGCRTTDELFRDKIVPGEEYDILEVTTVSGEHYVLKQLSVGDRGILTDSTIVGFAEEGKLLKIPLSQVSSIQVSRYDSGKTSLLILLGVPLGLFAIAGISVAMTGLW